MQSWPPTLPDEIIIVRETVPGSPVPKQRARIGGKGKRNITPTKTKRAEEQLAWMLALKADLRGAFIADRAIGLRLLFICPDRVRRDWDNMSKTVCDAANKVIYDDDYQVEDAHVKVIRGAKNPRTEILIWDLGPLK